MNDGSGQHLAHGVLRPDLDPAEILARFWQEVRPLKPQTELHVVDPYLLDAGGRDPHVYASNIAGLLKPLLRDVRVVTFVHSKERQGIRDALEQSMRVLIDADTLTRYVHAAPFHHRWVVADRLRLAKMDLSFNQIGNRLGGVDLVTAEQDRAEYCAALDLQDPPPANQELRSAK